MIAIIIIIIIIQLAHYGRITIYIYIPDFNFDTTTSGIKLNIEDTARHSQLKYLIILGLKKLLKLS